MDKEKKYIIANWKMALNHAETIHLSNYLKKQIKDFQDNLQLVVCPSFLSLVKVQEIFENTSVQIGAQDCFWEEKGGYTGEISPLNLKNLNCQYVILGHSERRKHLQETNDMVHRKCEMALKSKLIPILCIGENWEQRSEKQKDFVLINQLTEALQGISVSPEDQVIVAYEPVWAISTGEGIEAEPEEVQYAAEVIKQVLLDMYNKEITYHNFRVIYGGSVNSENVNSFLNLPNITGALVGAATQKTHTFMELLENIK